ncbi:MAG: DNA double-strand break repair protein Mre11 [Natronomonas sp.]
MTRVLHTADTHLGYRQYHLPQRRNDFLSAFEQVIEDAVDGEVDAVVHAGDLFDSRQPDLPDLLGCLEALRTLDDAGIPFLAVVGNHETKRDAQWLDLFETLGLTHRLNDEPLVVGDVAFYGMDFVPRSARSDLEYRFEPSDAEHTALVTHGLFEPLVPDYGNVEWDAAEVLAESNVDFDAMLLGDEHKPAQDRVDGTWVTYPGSTERASADERGDRGYNLVTFKDGDVRLSRRGIETRPFVFVDLELGPEEGADRVRERIREHDVADAVVVVTIEGDGEAVSPAEIEEFTQKRGALTARVTDRREQPEETEAVTFADPDDAVRDRIRSLGLSEAATQLDETIREGTVADSNVKAETERRVQELLEDAEDAAVFESAQSTEDGGADEQSAGDTPNERADSADEGDEPTDSVADPADGAETGQESSDSAEANTEAVDQSSMEEYL